MARSTWMSVRWADMDAGKQKVVRRPGALGRRLRQAAV